MLAAVWLGAVYFAVLAGSAIIEHRIVANDVAALRARTKLEFEAYSKELAKGERLRTDKEYQASILKGDYGYTKPDETPVIILRQAE